MLFGMKKRASTSDTLVANIREVMRVTGMKKPDLARKSGVSERMIGYILAKERSPTVDVADAIGRAVGLTGWQMIMPGLPVHLAKNGHLDKLVKNYTHLTDEGREYVNRVAEREAGYTK